MTYLKQRGLGLNIQVIAVGKLKEKYLREAVLEYAKRLSRFCRLDILEVAEEQAPESLSALEVEQIRKKEGDRIRKSLAKNTFCIALDLEGEQIDSPTFSSKLSEWMLTGKSRLSFIIGGSTGLDRQLVKEAEYSLCLSSMTFPHQIARVILLEQIYRGFKIQNNEPYHK